MNKRALVECPNCKRLNPLTSEQHYHMQCQPFTDNLGIERAEYIALGMICQHCDKWMHFGYYTPELIERRKRLTNRRRQRSFRRDYGKFQVEVEEVLNEQVQGM